MAKARAIAGAVVGEAVAERAVGDGCLAPWRWNSGDSSMVERAIQTLPASAAPTKKGMRQPQLCEVGLAHRGDGQRRNADREQRADLARGRGRGGDEAAPVRRRAFQQIGDDAGIFAADRETHHAAQQDQQPAGGGTDLRVCRQQRGGEHGGGHQRHRHQHHVPPSLPVADMAEEDRAQRPHQIGDGEPAERHQQRRLAAAEEDARQNGGEIEIEREVVPFDDGRESRDRQRAAGDRDADSIQFGNVAAERLPLRYRIKTNRI